MRAVLVLMDTLNRHFLKAYNPDANIVTPNIDAFARESLIFDNHFIGSAPCMPARRDLLTGRLGLLGSFPEQGLHLPPPDRGDGQQPVR